MAKLTESELDRHLKDLVNWERFALHLPKMKQPDISMIKKNERDVALQRLALYEKWLKVYPDASWKDVVQALEIIEENTIASDLKNALISVKPKARLGEVKVSKDIVEELQSLETSFFSITEDVKSEIEYAVDNDQLSVPRLVSRTIDERAYNIPELLNDSIKTPFDYFKAIQPHYSFLNCHLIIRLAVFLSQYVLKHETKFEEKVVKPAKDYDKRVESFKDTTQVIDLHNHLDQFIPNLVSDASLHVIIVIEKSWGRYNLWLVEELVKTLFGLTSHDECQWFRVRPGSLIVSFLVPKYLMMLLIVNCAKKLHLMRLMGVIGLQVGKIRVLKGDVNKTFSFDNSLIQATESSNIELVQFLLNFMEINVNKARETGIGTEVIIIPNNVYRLNVLQTRFAKIVQQIEDDVKVAIQSNRVTLEGLKKFIAEERPLYDEFVSPVNSVDFLLHVIKPFYNFLNHGLIVSIAQFLGHSFPAAQLANIYDGEAETFKTVVSVAHLKDSPHIYFQTSQPTGTIRVAIMLANLWQTCSVSLVERLMQVVFSLKHSDELQWFKVISGSLIIAFVTPKNKKRHLIENSQKKIEFMRLLGVISLKVGGDYVFKSDGSDYNLQSQIAEAKELGNEEALKFLYLIRKDSIATTQQTGIDSNHNLLFLCDADVTSLMIACSNSDTQLAKLFLANKANPNIETEGKSTALMYATMVGNAKIVQSLLDHNAEIDKINNWDETALYLACDIGNFKVVEALLARNPNVNTKEHSGMTPIFTASRNGHVPIVKMLIKAKADPNIPDKAGGTPLSLACEKGHVQVVKLLLQAKADPNAQNINGLTCLILAVTNGYSEIFLSLLDAKANPNLQNSNGTSPLLIACEKGRSKMVKALLKAQANPNIQDNEGVTPLYVASKKGHVKVLKILLEEEAKPDIPTQDGFTPLHVACTKKEHLQIVSMLLKAKASPNFQNKHGHTALMIAFSSGHLQIFYSLLESGANPNIQASSGVSLLHFACSTGNLEATRALINAKADPDIQDREGSTPLHIASENGNVKVSEILIKANADPNIQTNDGATALHKASEAGNLLIVTRLLNANADPNIQTNHGFTAYHIAEIAGHVSIQQLLLKHGANPDIRGNLQQLVLEFAKQFMKK